jgi:hypothetical protein
MRASRTLVALIKTMDPRLARLHICDLAAAVLHHAIAAYGCGDELGHAITVAPAYANGQAPDKERLKVLHMVNRFITDDVQPRHAGRVCGELSVVPVVQIPAPCRRIWGQKGKQMIVPCTMARDLRTAHRMRRSGSACPCRAARPGASRRASA